MLVESAITWLFVRISPDDEINIPVPAARPWASVVLMLTSAGSTFAAMAFMSSVPEPDGVGAGVLPKPGTVVPGMTKLPLPDGIVGTVLAESKLRLFELS